MDIEFVTTGVNPYEPVRQARLLEIDRTLTSGFLHGCANAVLIASMLPYISPILVPSMDVQLTGLGVSCVVIVLIFIIKPDLLKPCRTDFYILLIGLLTLVYLNPNVPGADLALSLRACAPIILGFPVYFAVRVLSPYMSPRIFVAVVVLYLIVILIQLHFPSLYAGTAGQMLSDVRFSPEDGRGPNGLTNEPSMMGNMCVFFSVSMYFFQREYWVRHKRTVGLVLIVSAFMLVLTHSGTGVVLALIVGTVALLNARFPVRIKLLVLGGMLAAVPILGGILSLSNSRSAVVLAAMAESPLSVLQDESLAIRSTGIFVGLYQIPHHPFGNGSVRQDISTTIEALNSDIALRLWPSQRLRDVLIAWIATASNNSGVGGMIQRMGVFAIVIILMLLHLVGGFNGKWIVRVFVVTLLLNASMFISTLWFIVGCSACCEVSRRRTGRARKQLGLQ